MTRLERVEAAILGQILRLDGQPGQLRFHFTEEGDQFQRRSLALPSCVDEARLVLGSGVVPVPVGVGIGEPATNGEPVLEDAGLIAEGSPLGVVRAEGEAKVTTPILGRR